MSSTLVAHVDSAPVTYATLKALPAPQPMGRIHQPIPHADLVDALRDETARRGVTITRERFALNTDGSSLFGVMDFAQGNLPVLGQPGEMGNSFGFRSNNRQLFTLSGVAGGNVFVCDNLALSGSIKAFDHKHTTGLDLVKAIRAGFDTFLAQAETLADQLKVLTHHELTDDQAKVLVFDAFEKKYLPARAFDDVVAAYWHPTADMTDCAPRTKWGLHNAFTRVIRDMRPMRAFTASVAIGQHFGLK